MMQIRQFVILTATALCSIVAASGQSLEQAKKMYADGEYEKAKPAFARLVRQAPNNASYNLWYGVCCHKTGDDVAAEKYLTVAAGRRVNDAYRFLGDMYMTAYRFDEAAAMYKEYAAALAKKKEDTLTYDNLVALAEKAQRMVDRVENVQIIDSLVIGKADFTDAYRLSGEAGTLSSYRSFFNSDEPVSSTVYENALGDRIYYAQPSDADSGRYNLFTRSRLMDNWGDEKRLPDNVNAPDGNNNYPFVLGDGVTVYYGSDANGSIGGYDIFITRYNINSDTYLVPEQLGMPFNSFANDYMMVIDEVKHLGWFVTDRRQPADSVCVYLFIPDPQRSRLETDSLAEKRSRAQLIAISDTQVPNAEYADKIRLAHADMPAAKSKEVRHDFDFVINNNITYHTLDDIKSPEARTIYEKYVNAMKQIKELNAGLTEMRNRYAAANATARDQMKAGILQEENRLEMLMEEPHELEKKARNAEITFLARNRRGNS